MGKARRFEIGGCKAVFAADGEVTSGGARGAPRSSGKEARQTAEDGSQDTLVGARRRQMQPDLGFHLNHAGRDLDQPKAQRVELRDPPNRALWHGGAGSWSAQRRGLSRDRLPGRSR